MNKHSLLGAVTELQTLFNRIVGDFEKALESVGENWDPRFEISVQFEENKYEFYLWYVEILQDALCVSGGLKELIINEVERIFYKKTKYTKCCYCGYPSSMAYHHNCAYEVPDDAFRYDECCNES